MGGVRRCVGAAWEVGVSHRSGIVRNAGAGSQSHY